MKLGIIKIDPTWDNTSRDVEKFIFHTDPEKKRKNFQS